MTHFHESFDPAVIAFERDSLVEALKAVRSYYFLANPTGLTEAQVCDLVCGVLDKIGVKVRHD